MKISQETSFVCHVCQKAFSSAWNFRRHFKSKHLPSEKKANSDSEGQTLHIKGKIEADPPKVIEKEKFKCHICSKYFATAFSFRRHLQCKHVKKNESSLSESMLPKSIGVTISNVEPGPSLATVTTNNVRRQEQKVFSEVAKELNQSQFKNQVKNITGDTEKKCNPKAVKKRPIKPISRSQKYKIKCLEETCTFKCNKLESIRHHLVIKHQILQEVEELVFHTIEEFQKWKADEENRCTAMWVKACGTKIKRQGVLIYYYCNRSGTSRILDPAKRKRALKSQGSCKINASCTSAIIMKKVSKGIKVTYFKSHYGHKNKLAHMQLSMDTKNMIAQKLIQGIPHSEILNKIRSNIDMNFERVHLTTNHDIHNIAQSFNLYDTAVKNPNDAISVDMWVNEMQKMKNENCVVIYKKQGEINSELSLKKEDFLLGLMTKCQIQILKKFGVGGIICMDATHGTNQYDFNLISILVVDDFGEGFPVGFLFSNREDYIVLKYFLLAVKSIVGDIRAATFMSDDADQYFAAWSSVMDVSETRKLLCMWHVDRAWRSKIVTIKDKVKQAEVYKTLCVLRQESNLTIFEESLKCFVNMLELDPDLKVFGKYFQQTYALRCVVWATCFRAGLGINTNMYLESMHKVLKYIYLKGLTCRRLDKTVHILLKYVRDKQFERIIKLEKGKITNKISRINKSHRSATNDQNILVNKINNEWAVKSGENTYCVKPIASTNHRCKLKCVSCDSCAHLYSCDCMDYIIHNNMCKHIHKVCIDSKNSKEQVETLLLCKDNDQITDEEEIQHHLLTLKKPTSILEKIGYNITFMSTFNFADIKDETTLNKINGILTSAKALMTNGLGSSAFTSEKSKIVPANKKILSQPRFFSTKRKRKTEVRLAKPSQEEAKIILAKLNMSNNCS